jgi:DNA-binding NarL/FixJ family response regulator
LNWEIIVGLARVFIVEENKSVRLALADRLNQTRMLQVIGHTGSAEEVIREVTDGEPDVVLVEVKRSDGMGLEILRQLSRLSSSLHLIVLTSYPSDWERKAAWRAGATSYLLKDVEAGDLINHISCLVQT